MALLDAVFQQLGGIGLYQYGLPLLVTFAVVYGILDRIELFEQEEINAIIGLVAGFFVANFAGGAGASLGLFLSNFFGAFAVVLVFLVGAMMAIELGSGGGEVAGKETLHRAVLWLGGIALVLIFLAWGGVQLIFPDVQIGQVFIDQTTALTLIVVLVAFAIIYYITG